MVRRVEWLVGMKPEKPSTISHRLLAIDHQPSTIDKLIE
jgi:hypothetical protein